MPDAFEQLRAALVPAEPDAEFAARLRDRLARAFDLPKGVTVSNLNLDSEAGGAPATAAGAALRHGDIGYVSLWVPTIEPAVSFYASALGWRYAEGGSGAARQVEGLTLPHGLVGGFGPSTLFCCFAVDDLAAAVTRVRDAGGTAEDPHLEPYGLISGCTDDQGVPLALFEPPGGVGSPDSSGLPPSRNGDVSYVTFEVVDSERTRAFYSGVLGWQFSPGHIPDGWQVENVAPLAGISGGHAAATTVPMYRVEDIHVTVAAVRAAGGSATDPEPQPYGITSNCTDDQGTRFYLGQF